MELYLLPIQRRGLNNHDLVEFACAITLRIHTVHIVWTQRSEVYIENILILLPTTIQEFENTAYAPKKYF